MSVSTNGMANESLEYKMPGFIVGLFVSKNVYYDNEFFSDDSVSTYCGPSENSLFTVPGDM